jgi:probable F420-dependent oxidoreductase
VRYIFGYPETTGLEADLFDAGPVGELAATAEAAGWEGFSFTEHPIPGANWLAHGGHQTYDPFIALSFAAAATQRMKLLTFLTVVPYRNPFILAKTVSSLDRLSGGRMILGVGTGYQKSEYFALGVDFDERNNLFDESLEVMRMAWTGEPLTYQGLHFNARNVIQRPRPVQDRIPIWIGGNSKLTLRRIAQGAEGWMPMLGSEELAVTARSPHLGGLAELRTAIAKLKADAGGRHVDIALGYTDRSIADPGADVGHHKATLAELEDMGVNWVVIDSGPYTDAKGPLELAERFASTYIHG